MRGPSVPNPEDESSQVGPIDPLDEQVAADPQVPGTSEDASVEPQRPLVAFLGNDFGERMRRVLLPDFGSIRAALLPDLARIFPHAAKIEASVQPSTDAWRKSMTKSLIGIDTERFLRQIRLQAPAFDASRLITPEFKTMVARLQARYARLIPDNLHTLDLAQWESIIRIAEEQRIGVVWVPREDILSELLAAQDEEARAAVLLARSVDVLDDCEASLRETAHPSLTELREFAQAAIDSHRSGHTAAAQALATNVLDTALVQHHDKGVSGMMASVKALQAQSDDKITLMEMRLRLATAGIPLSYRDYKYKKRDSKFSRNGTAHAVNMALYTPKNSISAITLAAAWLRWLHETWTDEVNQTQDLIA